MGRRWRRAGSVLVAGLLGLAALVAPARAASAVAYVPISGAGSTWSAAAIRSWTADVTQYGLTVTYAAIGSTAGRAAFRQGTIDWAGSDLPYGVVDGTATDPLPSRGFAYLPDTAGATTFAYHLRTGADRVTDLRLSGETIAKIFTGRLTRWDDPAIAADNPGLSLPAMDIVPVVRTDGSGATAQFTAWMMATQGQYWTDYCARVGRSPCTATSAYPVLPGSRMVGQAGDLGVTGYVSQVDGAIGYAQYSYPLQLGQPVAKVLNAAGYYTAPTPGHVGVSLLAARLRTDPSDPATYLTQDLSTVYTNPDARTSKLSSYSYLIVPTDTSAGFTVQRGLTLGDFGKYLLCQGQRSMPALGYSPLPINLVEAGYAQLQRIPGANVPPTTTEFLRACNNPTFSTDGTNTLAVNDPMPPACDRQGPTQCLATTPGDAQVETINVNVPSSEGALTMTVSDSPVLLGTAVLGPDRGTFHASGALSPITIVDRRDQSQPGWTVSGQIGDFTSGSHSFSGSALGWTPAVTQQNQAQDVLVGPLVAPGTNPGLRGGCLLALAPASRGLGTTVLGGALELTMPATTAPGAYTATLTVTVVLTGGP